MSLAGSAQSCLSKLLSSGRGEAARVGGAGQALGPLTRRGCGLPLITSRPTSPAEEGLLVVPAKEEGEAGEVLAQLWEVVAVDADEVGE